MTRTRRIADAARRAGGRAARSATSRSAVPFWAAGVAVVTVLTVFVASGGLAPAGRTPTAVEADAEVRTSLYAVTVTHAELTDAVEDQYLEAEPGEQLLVVTAQIENLSDRPIGVGLAADQVESRLINSSTPLLDVPESVDVFSTRAWRADGSSGRVILQPGVPDEVRLAWAVPDDAFPDGTAHLDVFDAEARGGQIIVSASVVTWHRRAQVARVSIDVAEAR